MPIMVPIQVPVNMTVESFRLFGASRFGLPTFLATQARENESGEVTYAVTFEWPELYAPLAGSAAQQKVLNEKRQLDRLRADFRASGGPEPFLDTREGLNPPDFVCTASADGSKVGVEMTQLTVSGRAEDHALFARVKSQVLGRIAFRPGSFDHLAGHLIAVSFVNDDRTPAKPIREKDVPGLIRGLEDFRPPVETGELPAQADPNSVKYFPGGILSSAPFPQTPDTRFFRLTGFELAFSTPTWIRERDAWHTLIDRVRDHDKPGVDLLVVVAGSPTAAGAIAHPVDGLLAHAVIERSVSTAVQVQHIKRIWLHLWPERAVYEVVPGQLGAQLLGGVHTD